MNERNEKIKEGKLLDDVVRALLEAGFKSSGYVENPKETVQGGYFPLDRSSDEVRLERFAKALLSRPQDGIQIIFSKYFVQSTQNSKTWQWENRIYIDNNESALQLLIGACKTLANDTTDVDYLSHHLEYILLHDQPCLAVLSPMAYETIKLALEASPSKKREITQALCKAPKTSIEQAIQQRLSAVLRGEKVKPPLCSICMAYPDYLELHKRL